MTVQNPNELARIHRFALKCYGWDLNIVEASMVQKMARQNVRVIHKTSQYMTRIIRNISYGYREVMDY